MGGLTTVYFDFETGGVEPTHPNISLAALAIRDGVEIGAAYWLIQFDEALAQPEALRINHYDPLRWLAEAKTEAQVANEFSAFLNAHKSLTLISQKSGKPYRVARLAGYNCATFDGPRVEAMFNRYGLFPPWRRPTLDVFHLVMEHADSTGMRMSNFRLTTVAEAFGIAADGAHDALVDCRLTAAIHAKLSERRAA